jgi:hypothetical protein
MGRDAALHRYDNATRRLAFCDRERDNSAEPPRAMSSRRTRHARQTPKLRWGKGADDLASGDYSREGMGDSFREQAVSTDNASISIIQRIFCGAETAH